MTESARRIREAIAGIPFPETVVIVSPHGQRTGVYAHAAGSLGAFGIPEVAADGGDPAGRARDVAGAWGRPILDEQADHGVVVPVSLGCVGRRTLGVSLEEGGDDGDIEEAARSLADAVASLGSDVALVASMNGARGLSPRAPLTERPSSKNLDAKLADALAREPARIGAIARELRQTDASCCYGPLLALARAFPGATFDIRAREVPVGVSYIVATSNP